MHLKIKTKENNKFHFMKQCGETKLNIMACLSNSAFCGKIRNY